ncbi:hypothetical protein [Ruegeria sp. SCSIO 43209]|nr:hypothetical protein [Ruegeria sp. SCSIO 43209]
MTDQKNERGVPGNPLKRLGGPLAQALTFSPKGADPTTPVM